MRTPLLALVFLVTPAAFAQTTDSAAVPMVIRTAAEAPLPTQTLAQIVTTDTTFSILATALRQTNLLASLEAGEFTLLAPTNAAFRALPNYPSVLEPESARALYSILMAHVVPGTYLAVHLPQMASLRTWAGTDLPLVTTETPTTDGGVTLYTTVGGASVVHGDVRATNGVLHVIGAVATVPEVQ